MALRSISAAALRGNPLFKLPLVLYSDACFTTDESGKNEVQQAY